MEILIILVGVVLGVAFGYQLRKTLATKKAKHADAQATKILEEVNRKKKEILINAKDESLEIITQAKEEENKRRERLSTIEEKLFDKEELFEKKSQELEKNRQEFIKKEEEIQNIKKEIDKIREGEEEKLIKISKLSKEEAKELLLKQTEKEIGDELVKRIKYLEDEAKEKAEDTARNIISTVIERYAADKSSISSGFTIILTSRPA